MRLNRLKGPWQDVALLRIPLHQPPGLRMLPLLQLRFPGHAILVVSMARRIEARLFLKVSCRKFVKDRANVACGSHRAGVFKVIVSDKN